MTINNNNNISLHCSISFVNVTQTSGKFNTGSDIRDAIVNRVSMDDLKQIP